jgi:hypothetical protein
MFFAMFFNRMGYRDSWFGNDLLLGACKQLTG